MKTDTVAGVERYLVNCQPNGLQCDGCGKTVYLERNTWRQEVAAHVANGWKVNSEWYGQDEKDYCPECMRKYRK